MRHWITLCMMLLSMAVTAQPAVAVLPSPAEGRHGEYQLKAYFLFNFAKFVIWADKPKNGIAPPRMVFGVLGENPFDHHLEQAITGEFVGGRQLVVVHFPTIEALEPCDVLFVSKDSSGRLKEIFQRLADHSTLTVGESADFLRAGGMVNFIMRSNKVAFEVNLTALDQAGLQVSSKLLRLAKKVQK